MKAIVILTRLFNEDALTADRVNKAQALAQRSRVDWSAVLAAMTEDQRAQVDACLSTS